MLWDSLRILTFFMFCDSSFTENWHMGDCMSCVCDVFVVSSCFLGWDGSCVFSFYWFSLFLDVLHARWSNKFVTKSQSAPIRCIDIRIWCTMHSHVKWYPLLILLFLYRNICQLFLKLHCQKIKKRFPNLLPSVFRDFL